MFDGEETLLLLKNDIAAQADRFFFSVLLVSQGSLTKRLSMCKYRQGAFRQADLLLLDISAVKGWCGSREALQGITASLLSYNLYS